MIFQLHVATTWNGNGGFFCDLNGLLIGSTFLGSHNFFFGVHQVIIVLHLENSFIGWLNLEVAVPEGSFGTLDVEGPEAGLLKIGFQDLTTFAVVDRTLFEALTEEAST